MHNVDEVKLLVEKARSGDERAHQDLTALVYAELRELAAARIAAGPPHALQPPALVHEAYLRVMGDAAAIENRAPFFFAASRVMRDIVTEHARRRARPSAIRERIVVPDNLTDVANAPAEVLLALDDALRQLEKSHPREHRLALLRFYVGLKIDEAADMLGISERTANGDWQFAKAFLHIMLTDGADAQRRP